MAGKNGGARPGAGRKKKPRVDVNDILIKNDLNPAQKLIEIANKAMEGINIVTKEGGVINCPDYEMARKIYSDLLSYAAPKLKAIEHSGVDGDAIEHKITTINVRPVST